MPAKMEIPTLCLIELAYQKAEKYKITEKNTPFHKFAIAVEEFGEVSRAMQENKRDEIVQELADTCIVLFILLKHYAKSSNEILGCFQNSIKKLK